MYRQTDVVHKKDCSKSGLPFRQPPLIVANVRQPMMRPSTSGPMYEESLGTPAQIRTPERIGGRRRKTLKKY